MIRSSDLDQMLKAMLEHQPWSEWQQGYYQCIYDMNNRVFRREIFRRWWQDPMFILGAGAGTVITLLLIGALATVIAR